MSTDVGASTGAEVQKAMRVGGTFALGDVTLVEILMEEGDAYGTYSNFTRRSDMVAREQSPILAGSVTLRQSSSAPSVAGGAVTQESSGIISTATRTTDDKKAA